MSNGEPIRLARSRGQLRRKIPDSSTRERAWNGRIILEAIPVYDAARDKNCVALAITSRTRKTPQSGTRAKRKQTPSVSFSTPQEAGKRRELEELVDPRVAVVNKITAELLEHYRSQGVLEDVYSFFLRAAETSGVKNQLAALSKELDNLKTQKSVTKQLSDSIQSREASISTLQNLSQTMASEPFSESLADQAQTLLSKHRVLTLTAVESLAAFRDYVRRITLCERRMYKAPIMREGEDLVGKLRRDTCFLESSALGQFFEFSRRSDPFLIYPAAHGRTKGRRLLEFPLTLGAKVTYAEKILLEETYAARDSNPIRPALEVDSLSRVEARMEPDTTRPMPLMPLQEPNFQPSVWLSPPPLSYFLSNAQKIAVQSKATTPCLDIPPTTGRVSPAESGLAQDTLYASVQTFGDAAMSVPLASTDFEPKPPEKPSIIPQKLANIRRKAAGIIMSDTPKPTPKPTEPLPVLPSPPKLADIRQGKGVPHIFQELQDNSPLFTHRQASKSRVNRSHTPNLSTIQPVNPPSTISNPASMIFNPADMVSNPAQPSLASSKSNSKGAVRVAVPSLPLLPSEKAFAPQALPDSETFRAPKAETKRFEETQFEPKLQTQDSEPTPALILPTDSQLPANPQPTEEKEEVKSPIRAPAKRIPANPQKTEAKEETKSPIRPPVSQLIPRPSKSSISQGLKPGTSRLSLTPTPSNTSQMKAVSASPEPEALPQPLSPTTLTLDSLHFQGPSLHSHIQSFVSALSPALQETFWTSSTLHTLLNRSFPSLIAIKQGSESLGLFAFHVNTQSTRSNRVDIVHSSATNEDLLGAVLDRCMSYIWEAFPCDEIRIEMRYRRVEDGFKPDSWVKSLLEGRGFRWKMLENDNLGERIMTLSTKRPETAPEKPFASLAFFEEQLVLRVSTVVQLGEGRGNTEASKLFSRVGPAACIRELGGLTTPSPPHSDITDFLSKLSTKFTFPATKVAKSADLPSLLQESHSQNLLFPTARTDTLSAAACSVLGLRFPVCDACIRLGPFGACSYVRLAPAPGYTTTVDGFSVYYIPCDDANYALMLLPLEGRVLVEDELLFFTEIYGKMTKNSKEIPRNITEVWLPAFETQESVEYAGFTGVSTASGSISACLQSYNVRLTAPTHTFGGIHREPSPEALVIEDSFILGNPYAAFLSRKLDDLMPIPFFVSHIPKTAFTTHR